MKEDFVIVGAGLYGATCARILTDKGFKVRVLEKEVRAGGHCDTRVRDMIVTHECGPHIFHTDNEEIWKFVNQFSDFNKFDLRTKVNYKDNIYSFPINLMTMNQIFGVITPEEAREVINNDRVPCDEPRNFEEAALNGVGKRLYEIFFYGYTKKQWGREPSELPASIFGRIPIRYTYDDAYFARHRNGFQGIPLFGYTPMIRNMLDGIDVTYCHDFHKGANQWYGHNRRIIYTGPIDEFCGYKFGKLEYRSLKFEMEKIDVPDFQGNAIINYTDESVPYTRIVEHKHFNPRQIDVDHTIITKEFPASYEETGIPYYPINTPENNQIAEDYKELAEFSKGNQQVFCGGRLAEYKYYDMDQTIESAMKLCERFEK